MAQRMDKAGGNKGTNKVTPKAGGPGKDRFTIYGPEYTQNISEEIVATSRLSNLESSQMNIPGQGNVSMAVGGVKEGSARRYADVMDQLTGPASVERDASDGNN